MNATVTNKHHFCKGVTLSIQNDKLTWKIDKDMQKYKYGIYKYVTCGFIQSDRDGQLDPQKLDDFILLIELIFEFTGSLTYHKYENKKYTVMLTNYLQIESEQNLTQWDIVKCIYDTPLEHIVKFVGIGHCGCNMGHCSAITGISINDKEFKTYGDVMAVLGDETTTENGNTYYEYPDSLLLTLEQITNLPGKIHCGYTCYSDKEIVTESLDPNTIYLSYGYGR